MNTRRKSYDLLMASVNRKTSADTDSKSPGIDTGRPGTNTGRLISTLGTLARIFVINIVLRVFPHKVVQGLILLV